MTRTFCKEPLSEKGGRVAILVLGVHRSGTSLLTRLISLLGAALPKTLMPPGEFNVRGHWEPMRLVDLNDEILRAIGLDWWNPGSIRQEWFSTPDAKEFTTRAAAIIADEFESAPLMVIKDPRMCRLAPLYLAALQELGIEARVILLLRHPCEVIKSLASRDGMDKRTVEALWIRYLLEAEEASRSCKRVWTNYENVLSNWPKTAAVIAETLGLVWPNSAESMAGEISSTIDPGMRHFSTKRDSPSANIAPLALRLWDAAQSGLLANEVALRLEFERIRTASDELERLTPVKVTPPREAFCIQVFADQGAGYHETLSVRRPLVPGCWQTVRFERIEGLHTDCRHRLRIDVVNHPALVEVAAIRITRDVDKSVFYEAASAEEFLRLEHWAGVLTQIESQGMLVFATDNDPRLMLPVIQGLQGTPSTLELRLRFAPALPGVLRHMYELEAKRGAGPGEALAKRESLFKAAIDTSGSVRALRSDADGLAQDSAGKCATKTELGRNHLLESPSEATHEARHAVPVASNSKRTPTPVSQTEKHEPEESQLYLGQVTPDALDAFATNEPASAICRGHLKIVSARPSVIFPGKPFKLCVCITNESVFPWPAESDHPVRVSYHWRHPDGSVWIRDGKRASLPADLLPGDQRTMEVQVIAPDTPSMAELELTVVQEGKGWFESHWFRSVRQPFQVCSFDDFARGKIEPQQEIPSWLRAGIHFALAVRLFNEGNHEWAAAGSLAVRVAYHWRAPDGSLLIRDGLRTNLPDIVIPQSSCPVIANLQTPDRLGRYILEWTLVVEGIGWFETSPHFKSKRIEVEIRDPDEASISHDGTAEDSPRRFLDQPKSRALDAPDDNNRSFPICRGRLQIVAPCPPWMFSEKPNALEVCVINESLLTWPANGADPVRVSYHWRRLDGSAWIHDGKRTSLPADLAPGGRSVVEVQVMGPDTPGMAELELTVIQEGKAWFESHGFGSVRKPFQICPFNDFARGKIEPLQKVPPYHRAGSRFSLAVRVFNKGSHEWVGAGTLAVRVSYHWHAPDGCLLIRDGIRTDLPKTVMPQSSCPMVADLQFPAKPGCYILEWTLVTEGVGWFETSPHFQSNRIEVEIRAPDGNIDLPDADREESRRRFLDEQQDIRLTNWIEAYDILSADDMRYAGALWRQWPRHPLISILMTGIEAEEHYLVAAIESVLAQLYPHWELCIADNVSTEPHIRRILDNYARQDARIRVAYREINGHVAVAYNTALEMAQGEVCLMFDSDDVLATHALLFVAGELVLRPDLEWIYCDSDLLDGAGRRFGPQFVGDANPDLFRSIDFMAVHACFSTRRMRELGGIRIGYEEAYNYDLGLRFLENIDLAQIRHIPHILYHARAIEGGLSNSYLLRPMNQDNGLRALQDHLDRLGIQARAEQRINNPGYRIRYAIPTPAPLVSIIIPTRDRLDLLRPCVASIMERTDYPAFEILIIDNSSSEPGTRAFLEYLVTRGVRIERFDAPFNWSAMNNFGVTQARGELLCFLNNDTEVINESWLTEMVSHAVRPDIGVVGAALWYPDNRLQHGGVIGMGMGPGHVFTLSDRGKWSNWRRATQNYLAVTGACFVVRKALYHQMGGFNAGHLAVAFNDVDFCFRVTETTGLRNLWTPFAELFHHETATRGPDDTEEKELKNRREVGYFYGIWLHWLENDPYVNPNLAWSHEVSLAEPPRVLARKTLHRYRIPPPPKLAVVHIPRAAGSVLRKRLSAEYPGPGTFIASGSEILGIYEQNPDVLARVSERARMAQVWFARFSYGVGRLLQHPCVYLTVLRDPVERVISHYRYITSASNSPLFGSILSELPLEDMVRKGVICSNLMTKKLLGGAPEEARMIDIMQSERAYGLPFVGFKFPPGIWAGRDDALLAAPDLPPDADFADLDRAFDVIAKEFGFVGLREALKLHTERLAETLGWDRSGPVPEIHVSGNSSTFEVTDGMRKTIEEYNQLDRRLYDSIAKKPGGFLLNETLLSSCARH